MNRPKIAWLAFWAWIGIEVVFTAIVAIEESGIVHWQGRIPITWMAVQNPELFLVIELGFLTLSAWWAIHWYRRKYGDIAQRKNKQ